MKVSSCCGSGGTKQFNKEKDLTYEDVGLCDRCGEHCEYIEELPNPRPINSDDRGGTGHGDISYSDADSGL